MFPLLTQSPESASEIIPVGIRDRLLSDFLNQRFEVAQGGDRSSGVTIEPGDVLAGATQEQSLLDLLQGQTLVVEANGQLAVRRGEGALDAGGLELQTGDLIDVLGLGRFRLPSGGSSVRPEGLADLEAGVLVLIAGEGELTEASRLEFTQIGGEGAARLAQGPSQLGGRDSQFTGGAIRFQAQIDEEFEGPVGDVLHGLQHRSTGGKPAGFDFQLRCWTHDSSSCLAGR